MIGNVTLEPIRTGGTGVGRFYRLQPTARYTLPSVTSLNAAETPCIVLQTDWEARAADPTAIWTHTDGEALPVSSIPRTGNSFISLFPNAAGDGWEIVA